MGSWEDYEVYNLTMDTPLIDLSGIGETTIKVFRHAGFFRVGDLYPHNNQEIEIRRATEELARRGDVNGNHWRALSQRCVTVIKRIRNPQFSDIVPDVFICPITYEPFEDPVITPYGHSYERDAIQRALESSNTDPLTRQPLTVQQLVSNINLKDAVQYYNENLRRAHQLHITYLRAFLL